MPITSRAVLTLPTLPTLGSAGYQFVDPIFGSRMLRVTDPNVLVQTNTSFRTPSSSPSRGWNADSTKFYVTGTQGTIIPYGFNPSSMTASRMAGSGDGGLVLHFSTEGEFSQIQPSIIYGGYGRGAEAEAIVQQYDFSNDTYTTLVGVRDLVPTVDAGGRTYLRGISTGYNGTTEYLGFMFGGLGQDNDRYIAVWPYGNLGAVKLLDSVASTINGVPTATTLGWRMHAMQMDKSGRYVIITKKDDSYSWIWDTTTGTISHLSVATGGGGHEATGWQTLISNTGNDDSMDWRQRYLAVPFVTRSLISPFPVPGSFATASHANWNNTTSDMEQPVFAAIQRVNLATNPWREWEDEIISMRTDGTGTAVTRYCHHRSNCEYIAVFPVNPAHTDTFYYSPRPNVSPDGHWCVFTSNWNYTLGDDPYENTGANKRQDVFLVETATGGGNVIGSTHRAHRLARRLR